MPDWITHLGGGYLLYRPISLKDMRLVLLGCILPDILSRICVILEDIFNLYVPKYYQLEAFHTPFMLILLAIFISLFAAYFWRCFALLLSGGILHFILDMCDVKMEGCGQLLFYPVSYKTYQFNLFSYNNWGYYLIVAACLALLLYYCLKQPYINECTFKFQRKGWAAALLLVILIMPHITWRSFWRNNIGYMVFFAYPEQFENKKVALHFTEVISNNSLIVKEWEQKFEIITDQRFDVGDYISLIGIYKDGKIYPSKIKLEIGNKKIWLSVAGLLLFPLLWFDPSK